MTATGARRVGRPWAEAELAVVRQMREAGKPLKAIARRTRRCWSSVSLAVERLGLTRRRSAGTELGHRCVDLAGDGLTRQQIADRLGITRGRVGYWLARAGVSTRSPGRDREHMDTTMGLNHGQSRYAGERARSLMAGWPPVTAREAEYLAAVEAGARTRAEIATAVGNDGVGKTSAMLCRLVASGFLVVGMVALPPYLRWRKVYQLAATVAEMRERVRAYQSEETPA